MGLGGTRMQTERPMMDAKSHLLANQRRKKAWQTEGKVVRRHLQLYQKQTIPQNSV